MIACPFSVAVPPKISQLCAVTTPPVSTVTAPPVCTNVDEFSVPAMSAVAPVMLKIAGWRKLPDATVTMPLLLTCPATRLLSPNTFTAPVFVSVPVMLQRLEFLILRLPALLLKFPNTLSVASSMFMKPVLVMFALEPPPVMLQGPAIADRQASPVSPCDDSRIRQCAVGTERRIDVPNA